MANATTADVKTMQELLGLEGVDITVPKAGDVLEAKVLSVGKNEVYVDIEGIGLGVVRGRELFDESVRVSTLKVGDVVMASVVEAENKEGNIELSFRAAGQERVWQTLAQKMKDREIIKTKILEANKGGLMVEVSGVIGFLPVSQLSSAHYPRVEEGDKNKILEVLKSYVGKIFDVAVITADAHDEKLIVSEKAVGEEELRTKIGKLTIGQVVEGEVSGIVDFGIFLKFGEGLEGLVHISELAWTRIEHPKDLYKVGQMVKAAVITIDRDRISLSIKRLQPDPWVESIKKYQVGQIVKGKVNKIMQFGAFVELDPEIYGLVHSVELSIDEVKDPGEIVKIGDELEFKIISIEPQEHRLGLSLRAVTAAAEPKVEAKAKTEAAKE